MNGGLFADDAEIPNFTAEIKHKLLFDASQEMNWSHISPTIFGGIFESTLNPETRRSGGMHYTSPENIHKVIDPLFLDSLKAEYDSIIHDSELTERKRMNRLRKLHQKIVSLTFFDPACGSGNFLTETYLSLRKLEDEILYIINHGQTEIAYDFEDGPENKNDADNDRVRLSQFYGIEINDFAVRVAKTALWIAQLQANNDSEMLLDLEIGDFPLTDSPNIIEGNALRIEWEGVVPHDRCKYIMGNPPFVGAYDLSAAQKEDRRAIFGSRGGVLDYVACWYERAVEYIGDGDIRCAFVSTNSICQGQQVEPLWKLIFERGFHIDFAWTTFYWSNEATDPAHVHCVIVGLSKVGKPPRILFKTSEDEIVECDNINGYLQPAPDWFVVKRGKPISDVAEMAQGFKPADHGNLLLSDYEKNELLTKEPAAEKWIRPFSMGEDFVKGNARWCLWLTDITPDELASLSEIEKRVRACRDWRSEQTKTGDAYKLRTTPHLLRPCNKFHDRIYIGVPKVTSGKRSYIPMGFVDNGMIPGDKLYFVDSDSLYVFGILMSQFHNAWMRTVGGRMKSDYSYANTVIYNNFVFPNATDEQKAKIERAAQAVLDARANHPSATLAEMYDGISPVPEGASDSEARKYDRFAFDDLKGAHDALDSAVEEAYGVDFNGDEEKIVAHLFKLYADASAG